MPEYGIRWKRGLPLLRKLGCELMDIHLPHTDYAIATYYIIATAEASSNLARYDGVRFGPRVEGDSLIATYRKTRGAGFGAEVKRRIVLGTYVLSAGYYDAYYLKGQKVRALIAQDFREAFQKVDVIVTPTSPVPAFKLGERVNDPLQMYLADIYTVTGSLRDCRGSACRAEGSAASCRWDCKCSGRHLERSKCCNWLTPLSRRAGLRFREFLIEWWACLRSILSLRSSRGRRKAFFALPTRFPQNNGAANQEPRSGPPRNLWPIWSWWSAL